MMRPIHTGSADVHVRFLQTADVDVRAPSNNRFTARSRTHLKTAIVATGNKRFPWHDKLSLNTLALSVRVFIAAYRTKGTEKAISTCPHFLSFLESENRWTLAAHQQETRMNFNRFNFYPFTRVLFTFPLQFIRRSFLIIIFAGG